jgi:gamma-glutamylcyclotransferase (GGCT)/AIG2-like uncharacterized protein YtfP
MVDSNNCWFENINESELSEILTQYNHGKNRRYIVDKTKSYFDALNKLWNSFNKLIQNNSDGRVKDSSLFKQLILKILSDKEKMDLCKSRELLKIIKLSPKVMNHDTLRNLGYNPDDISAEIEIKSQSEHTELENEFRRYKSPGIKPTALIKKLCRFLYVVRSNLMHGEKTPFGPDTKKVERDKSVCNAVIPILELLFEYLCDYPSNYLCIYGTLAPEKVNNDVLKNISGSWLDCKIKGDIFEKNGLPFFNWNLTSTPIKAQLFTSEELRKYQNKIDNFEGKLYNRILIPTQVNDQVRIAFIYSENDQEY